MTGKQQTLIALMEEHNYSRGLVTVALQMVGDDRVIIDEMIGYIYDENPDEDGFIAHLADQLSHKL